MNYNTASTKITSYTNHDGGLQLGIIICSNVLIHAVVSESVLLHSLYGARPLKLDALNSLEDVDHSLIVQPFHTVAQGTHDASWSKTVTT